MGVLADVNLHLVDSLETALELQRWLGERRETPIAIDTETSGFNPHKETLRLVQFGDKRDGWAIPFADWAGFVRDLLRKMRRQPLIMHNRAFDSRFLHIHAGWEVPWENIHDTVTMSPLVNPLERKALKPFSAAHIDPSAAAGQEVLDTAMTKNGWTWGTVPTDFPPYWIYGALDTVLTAWNFDYLWPTIQASYLEPYYLEIGVTRVYADMMMSGLLIDVPYIQAERERLGRYAEQGRAWLQSTYGLTTPGSSDQIVRILLSLGESLSKRTKGGSLSADKEVMALMKDWASHPMSRQLATVVTDVRHAEKLVNGYLDNFLEFRDRDDVIHASINPMAARTGRSSITEPALQTLPREDKVARGAFIPRPGHVLISYDLDQVEARITAHFSQDPGLIQAFLDADELGTDFFCTIASQIFQEEIRKGDKRRDRTKNVTYGEIYGSGLPKMAETAGVPVEQMRPVKEAFERLYPGIKALNRNILAQAREYPQPCVFTPTGRRLVGDADRYYTQLLNALIQGHAAEYLKQRIMLMDEAGLGPYLRLVVHDEVIAEVPTELAEEVAALIGQLMSDRTSYAVPITAAGKIMPERWQK